MKGKKDSQNRASDLRRQAEKKAADTSENLKTLSPEAAKQLLHELRGHQIELEMQNEELRQAQEDLEASRAQYFDLYDLAPVGYLTISEKGLILQANLTGAHLLGIERRALLKQPLTRFIAKEDQDIYYLHRRQLFDTREPQVCEFRMVYKDGSLFWVRVNATIAQDSKSGAPVCLAVMSDITQRKQTEEALKEREEFLNKIVEQTPTPMWVSDEKGAVTRINQALKDLLKVTDEEIIGKYNVLEDAQVKEQGFFSLVKSVFEKGKTVNFTLDYYTEKESQVELQQKTHRILDIVISPIKNKTGNIINAICLQKDITEQKKTEEYLRLAEENFRNSLDNSPLGVRIVTVEGETIYANKAILEIIGFESIDELNATPRIKYYTPESYAEHQIRKEKRQQGEYVPSEYGISIVRKTGELRHLQVLRREVYWNGTRQFQVIYHDITERKHLEEERQRVAKLESIGVLAGGIAHDFNNILTAILGNISLAKMETKPESELYTRLEEAEKASLRAKNLTQQLLTFSKGGTPIKKLASISEMLKDTASFALRGSNIKCQFSIPDDLWHAEIDEGQISQIINNMVINAQQAMPTGGTIEVRAENVTLTEKQSLGKSLPLKKGKYIRIAIADQGTGISQAHLDKIFDPFFTTKQKGSGLGLATSYSIIHNHGGHVSVESKLGTGSTFYVYLPASTKTATTRKTEEKQTIPVSKARILVMDDEETVREVASRMLKHIGYEDIQLAADGAEAIKLYSEAMKAGKPFDAVILDITIPGGMGGKEAIKKLLEIDSKVKAIVSSGYSNESAIADYKEYGFKGMVAKPYTIDQLRKALHELIG